MKFIPMTEIIRVNVVINGISNILWAFDHGQTIKGSFKNDVTAKMGFLDPPPPLVTICHYFGSPPSPHVTGANGDKLFSINGWRKKL